MLYRGDWALCLKPVLLFSVLMLMAGCVSDNWVDRTLLKPVETVRSTPERSTDCYDNGQRKYERSWKGHKLDGPVTWWYENGKKKQLNFKDDEQHELPIWWNENGKKCIENLQKRGRSYRLTLPHSNSIISSSSHSSSVSCTTAAMSIMSKSDSFHQRNGSGKP